jgi:hypothetical protein
VLLPVEAFEVVLLMSTPLLLEAMMIALEFMSAKAAAGATRASAAATATVFLIVICFV